MNKLSAILLLIPALAFADGSAFPEGSISASASDIQQRL